MRGLRAPTAGFVVRERRFRFRRGPLFEDRYDDLPTALGHVRARIKRRIAEDAIEQQAFVSFGELDAERCAVAAVNVHVADARDLAGHFRADAQANAFAGLDAY